MSDRKISSRVKEIIEILCDSYGPITIKEISEKIDVSSRTILREMFEVEKWVKYNGLKIDKKPRVGVILKGSLDEKNKLKSILTSEKTEKSYSPKERQTLILNELLQNNEPIKQYYFTTIFKVSEGTISHDLDKVEQKIKNYNLKLIRKPGLGIYIEGEENAFRKAIINLLYEYFNKEQILNIMNQNMSLENEKNNISISSQTRNRLLDLIDIETILKIEKIVEQGEKQIEYRLTDSDYVGLLVHLALSIKRIKNGESISMQEEIFNELKISEEYEVAKNIVQEISKEFDISIPDDEIGYVTMHLKGAKIRNITQRKDDFTIGNFELIKIANRIIKYAEKESGYSLKNDKNLLVGLVSHLQSAITRLKMNMDIRNPLLEKIKEKYSEYFEISKESLEFLEEKFDKKIPESEVGYITMHLGSAIEKAKILVSKVYRVVVSCTSGIGSSKMLATRLNKEYKNIKIVDVISTIEIKEMWLKENKIDFIISTVGIKNNIIPVITVTPLLIDEDIEKLNDFISEVDKFKFTMLSDENKEVNMSHEKVVDRINLKEKATTLIDYSNAIINLLSGFFLEEISKANSIEELIDKLSLLVSVNDERANIIKYDLLEREKLGSTILKGRGLMLIHSRTNGIDALKLGIIRLKEPVNKLNEDIQLVLVMLAPTSVSKRELEVISEISKKLVTDKHFVDVLLKGNEEKILNEIKYILHDFLIDKGLNKGRNFYEYK